MTKLERVNDQIGKTKAKIAEFQERLRQLEQQKSDIEDKEILQKIHGFKGTRQDIMAFLENCKKVEVVPETKPKEGGNVFSED